VDPYLLSERFGVDALRFFLLRTFPFGSDGNFTNELLINTINMDLANVLGNLVSRTTAMAQKYFEGKLVSGGEAAELDGELRALAAEVIANYEKQMDAFQFSVGLNEAFKLINRANKYIDETAPWVLAKSEETKPRLLTVLKNLCECIRVAAILVSPVMPDSAKAILDQLNVPEEGRTWEALHYCDDPESWWTTSAAAPLFPRIDMEKELAALEELKAQAAKAALPALEVEPYTDEKVDFETFCKNDLRAVKVLECVPVKKSDKLLQFTLDDGSGTNRQILSGIAKFYKPEELVGKTLVAITNLPPRKMMGRESCGMLLSAIHTEKGEEKLNLIMISDSIPAGAKLC